MKPRSISQQGDRKNIKSLSGHTTMTNFNTQTSQIIKKDEIERIKSNATYIPKEKQNQIQNQQEELNQLKMKQFLERKNKMAQLQKEKQKEIPLTQDQLIEKQKREDANFRVLQNHYENLDHNKLMNKMVDYAKCVTIRDQQLKQKKQIAREQKSLVQLLETKEEYIRLMKVKDYEDHEEKKRSEYKKYLKAIQLQQEQKRQKLKQQKEQQILENQLFLEEAKRNQELDKQEQMNRKIKQHHNNCELFEENQKAVKYKAEVQRQRELELLKIDQYNQEKAKKEIEFQKIQKKIQEEKEKEIQRLRELQEKSQDKQAEIDEIQARRATEAKERVAREREQKQLENKQIMEKEENKFQQARDILEEGKLLKDEISNEIQNLEVIRRKKLDWYESVGIDKKYTIELARKKIAY